MEPTIKCEGGGGCTAAVFPDGLTVAEPALPIERGDIIVFHPPPKARRLRCGARSFVKLVSVDEGRQGSFWKREPNPKPNFVERVVGLPGETLHEDDHGFIWIREPNSKTWVKLNEPYISAPYRPTEGAYYAGQTWHVPRGDLFTMGDNRRHACDSRSWGPLPSRDVIGTVVQIHRGKSYP